MLLDVMFEKINWCFGESIFRCIRQHIEFAKCNFGYKNKVEVVVAIIDIVLIKDFCHLENKFDF